MDPKRLIIDILASDQRIRNYNKNPTKKTADSCIKAYEEAIIKFCKLSDEWGMIDETDKLESSGETNSDYLLIYNHNA